MDESLIRIMCKMLRLTREIETVRGDHWPRVRWIATHITSAQKEEIRKCAAIALRELVGQMEMDESFQSLQRQLAQAPPGPERELLKSLKEIRVRPLQALVSMLNLFCQKAPRRHREFAIELHHALRSRLHPTRQPHPPTLPTHGHA
jgi:hypothetical protein